MKVYLVWKDDLADVRQMPELVGIYLDFRMAKAEARRLQSIAARGQDGRLYDRYDVDEREVISTEGPWDH